jgi:uncharacterized protein
MEDFDDIFASIAKSQRRKLPVLRSAPSDCPSCGACCSHYKIVDVHDDDRNFKWLKQQGLLVDSGTAMKSDIATRRCIALIGEIGKNATCSIYDKRPESCRTYKRGTPRCRTAIQLSLKCDFPR